MHKLYVKIDFLLILNFQKYIIVSGIKISNPSYLIKDKIAASPNEMKIKEFTITK